ncbi:MAG: hypothetical protein WDM86_13025 [Rhizomicrobium sp.]
MRFFFALFLALSLATAPVAAADAPKPGTPPQQTTPPPPVPCTSKLCYLGGTLSVAVVTIFIVWVATSSEILRSSEPHLFPTRRQRNTIRANLAAGRPAGVNAITALLVDYQRCFSFSQSQMIWWFWIIASSFVYIVWRTEDFFGVGFEGGLTQEALILLGIGAGTAVGAAVVSQAKADPTDADDPLNQFTAAAAAYENPPAGATPAALAALQTNLLAAAERLKSDGFLNDILSDQDGISLHRFQAVAWAAALGVIFMVFVVRSGVAMPQLSVYELALLGISSGTYLGLKTTE